ncbi:hypothetical protein L1887_34173 [Cichorium endivia]|nr:hypothetical protein L1887_34173 [Cichorium endivia]
MEPSKKLPTTHLFSHYIFNLPCSPNCPFLYDVCLYKEMETLFKAPLIDFKLSDDPKIALQRYGQHLYDGLILFSPTTERFGGSLDMAAILDFVDTIFQFGHHILMLQGTRDYRIDNR